MTDSAANAPPGSARQFGRYTLLAKIATGGMAEIFLAKQRGVEGFEKLVVVKKILESFSSDEEFVELFLDEARIAAQLSHPHIVQTFDLGKEQGSFFIAMEYLHGESLSTVARAARKSGAGIPMPISARWISVAAEALHHAHVRKDPMGRPLGIVHRDVSPQNLFVTYEGALKVVDFGIAKAANRVSRTATGEVRGKLSYMAPEQMAGSELDARADVFALGVVLFELLTGGRLVEGNDPARAVGIMSGAQPMPRASERNPAVPEALDEIVARAMARDRDQRFASGLALHQALEEWLRSVPGFAGEQLGHAMERLFAARIEERRAFLEAALAAGDEALVDPGALRVPTGETDKSMPGRTFSGPKPAVAPVAAAPGAPRWPLAVGALGLLVGGFAVWRTTAAPPAEPARPVELARVVEVPVKPAEPPKPVAPPTDVARPVEPPVAAEPPKPTDLPKVAEPAKPTEPVKAAEQPRTAEPKPIDPNRVAEPARGSKGKLSLQTTPWTTVTFKGKALGETPLVEVPFPAGTHRLLLVNEAENIRREVEVEIEAGKTKVVQMSF